MSRESASWFEVAILVPSEWEDATVTYLIDQMGVLGVTVEDPIPPAQDTGLKFYLSTDDEFEAKLKQLTGHLAGLGVQNLRCVSCVRLPEANWQAAWQKYSVPLQEIGRRLLIKPPWIETPFDTDREVIEIKPALAFGTGTHPTTRSCLLFLDDLFSRDHLGSVSVLDLGCGSGILAIAAAKLGAAEVLAVDHDPDAVAAARENVETNGVAHLVRVAGSLPNHRRFDLVVANLTAETLKALGSQLTAAVEPGGVGILSGVLVDQEAELLEFFRDSFSLVSLRQDGEWSALLVRRAG